MTFLTPAGLETRHGPNIPIANPSRRSARPNRDTNRSNTASVGRSHTAASQMLAKGASLAEVGEALRQRSAASTAIYAKAGRARLAALARPWPGSAR